MLTMLPAARLLAERFPSATIHLLVDARYESFLRNIDLRCVVHGVERPESLKGFVRAVASVRQLKVDLALSMSPPKRNAAIALTSGAPRKAGYLSYVHTLTPYLELTPIESYGCVLPRTEFYGLENIEERSLKVCKALGIISEKIDRSLGIDSEVLISRQRALTFNKRMPGKNFVVLHPFSGWKFRSWSVERFSQLAQKILMQKNCAVVFMCEKKEEEGLELPKQRFSGHDDVFFFSSDDLIDTCAVMRAASLVVCNDSGPLHLAAALGAKVVGLFGPATPQLTAPRKVSGVFHYERVECSPCHQSRCVRPTDTCMSLISSEEVFQSVMRHLSIGSVAETVANDQS